MVRGEGIEDVGGIGATVSVNSEGIVTLRNA